MLDVVSYLFPDQFCLSKESSVRWRYSPNYFRQTGLHTSIKDETGDNIHCLVKDITGFQTYAALHEGLMAEPIIYYSQTVKLFQTKTQARRPGLRS